MSNQQNSKSLVSYKGQAELTCLIRPKMGIVSCPTLSITKLLNQQEAGCIHLGSKRSFLMRRRSVFHHIYPPNSKKVWFAFGERLRDQLLSQFHYFVYQKENIANSLFHSQKNWMTSVSLNIMRTSTAEIDPVQNQNIKDKSSLS